MYYYIEPEVAGGFGAETILDNSSYPPGIIRLEYEFSGWLGDDLLEIFPCYIVTENLMEGIVSGDLRGIAFQDVLISKSGEFEDFYPDVDLPTFYWAKITGVAGQDDFVIAKDSRLLVSGKALRLLEKFKIGHAEVLAESDDEKGELEI